MVVSQYNCWSAPAPQAVDSEEKEDREIICAELFGDITCPLDAHAKGAHGTLAPLKK